MAKQKQKEEEIHQVAFTRWFRLQYPKYKDLMTLGSFGENVGSWRMGRLKQMGLTTGYPDLVFYIPRSLKHGLFIEMKSKIGQVRANQKAVHALLEEMNYSVKVARSWDEAKIYVKEYLHEPS